MDGRRQNLNQSQKEMNIQKVVQGMIPVLVALMVWEFFLSGMLDQFRN